MSVCTINASSVDALQSEVHVWLARPEDMAGAAGRSGWLAMLCAEETGRYRRFRFDKDRQLYLLAHVLLRRVLSRYADVDPPDWRFARGEHGRPEIAAPRLPVKLRFNLSHTDGLAACVVTLTSDCGVDVERTGGRRNMPGIAARFFAQPEQHELRNYEGCAGYQQRFLAYWTLREAWCKALGTGLAHTDRSVWFELDKDDAVRMRGAAAPEPGAGYWQTAVLRPTAAHMLAIAVRSADAAGKRIVCRFLQP